MSPAASSWNNHPQWVMVNTGDSPATILKYYTKLPEVVMRRFVESKPVIPSERV